MKAVVCIAIVAVAVVASSASFASAYRGGDEERLNNLRFLLNEGEVPTLLTYSECQALAIDDTGGSNGGNNCGANLWWWPTWPYDADGYCASGVGDHTSFAAADAQCTGQSPTSSLINMRNNGERCIITFWVNKYNDGDKTYWTAVNDVVQEGTYVDGDGNPVHSQYLNWAAGEPTGADEDCVVFINDEAYDVNCATGTTGRAVCTKQAQANA